MSTATAQRSVLQEAAELITGDRRQNYGSPLTSFSRIADLWSAYLAHRPCCTRLAGAFEDLTAEDVACMMMLLKVARFVQSRDRDSMVDMAGYAGCLELIQYDRAHM